MALPFIIAVAIFLGLSLYFYHELRHSPGPKQWGRTPRWGKKFRVAFATVSLSGMLLLIWSVFIEPNRLVLHPETIQIAQWPKELTGLKIAVISDIHTGGPFIDEAKLKTIVEKTDALNPDLIVLLGDYMSGNNWHSHRVDPEVTAAVLKTLKAPLGVYAVLGNHDWWFDGERCRRALEGNGIRVLENQVQEIKWREGSFWLAGLSDLWTRPQLIASTIDQVPARAPIIALTHNPDIFPRLPERVPLLLAGHTHGGQVNIPLLGAPIVPSSYGPKYTAGHVVENRHHLFVTTGIGISILPVRF